MQLRFSTLMEKLTHSKKSLKSSCLGLIECLGENKPLSNGDIDDFLIFIQTVR